MTRQRPLIAALMLTAACGVFPTRPALAQADRAKDLAGTLASKGRYKTLINLLVLTDLIEPLRSGAAFTVFAPADDAFAKLPQGTLETLLKPENRESLRQLLAYHVVPKALDFRDLSGGATPKTLSGEAVTLAANGHGRAVNDATVLASQAASNGIIYRIDRVLMPLPDPLKVAKSAGLTTLVKLVEQAGLGEVLQGAGPFTIFAPTDEAFAKLGPEALSKLAGDPSALKSVLLLHVAPIRAQLRDLRGAREIKTLAGTAVPVSKDDHGLKLGERSRIVKPDVPARNGFVHVIDSVLSVDRDKASLIGVASESGQFKTLLAAAKAAGLAETLGSQGPFTVFAPTDEAFAKLGEDTLKSLLKPGNKDKLAAILKYHVLPGSLNARALVAAGDPATILGPNVKIAIRKGRLFVDDAEVIGTDVEAANGLIHAIDRVLTPPRD